MASGRNRDSEGIDMQMEAARRSVYRVGRERAFRLRARSPLLARTSTGMLLRRTTGKPRGWLKLLHRECLRGVPAQKARRAGYLGGWLVERAGGSGGKVFRWCRRSFGCEFAYGSLWFFCKGTTSYNY